MDKLSPEDWIALAAAIHGLAIVVVNLTPTPRDDEFLRRFYKIIEALAGILTPLAKK